MAELRLPLSAEALEKLLAFHDGNMALLYLYLALHGPEALPRAAQELCFSQQALDTALKQLRLLGLLSSAPASPAAAAADKPLLPADETPELTAEELGRRAGEDRRLAQLIGEAERVFGRKLSSAEMRTLCGMYDHLELPVEVVYILLHFCADEALSRHVRLSMRTVEKEAYRWNDLEILTLEQAEEHLRRLSSQKEALRRLLPLLGIRDREPTQTERGYLLSWLELGFEDEALSIAYDRTVTKTGKLSWPYMNKILLSWHGKGLHTPAEIEAGDGRAPRKSGPGLVGSAGEQKTEVDLDGLRALRGKI